MATIGGELLTLREIASQIVNGAVLRAVNVLSQTNDWMNDAVFVEANSGFSHVVSRVASRPKGTLRGINQGVNIEFGSTYQVTETMQSRDGQSQVDSALLMNPRTRDQIRRNKDDMFASGMFDELSTDFIYGNPQTDPLQMVGLSPRLEDLSQANVHSAGGSGSDLSSIFVIKWNPETGAALTYPTGEGVFDGVQVNDKGEHRVTDDDGKPYFARVTEFVAKIGLSVNDDRCIQRIANIEKAGTGSGEFDPDLLIDALNNLPAGPGVVSILCNKEVKAQIRKNAKDKANVTHTPDAPFGKPIERFDEVPIRTVEAILSTESAIA